MIMTQKIVVFSCYHDLQNYYEILKKYATKKNIQLYPYDTKIIHNENNEFDVEFEEKNPKDFIYHYSTCPISKLTFNNVSQYHFDLEKIERDDPDLIVSIEEYLEIFGDDLDQYGNRKIRIVEIPDNIDWEIERCEGNEWVAEKHRCWYS